jgi:hypothetical protein
MRYKARQSNPYADRYMMEEIAQQIEKNLSPYPFKYIKGYVAKEGYPSIILSIALEPKHKWLKVHGNEVIESVPYAKVSIDSNGTMEMFDGCIIPELKKSKVQSINAVLSKLWTWGERVMSIKRF